MRKLILEVREKLAQVVIAGGAGDSKGGLLIGEVGQQIDLNGRAELAELRDIDLVGRCVEVAQRINDPGIEIARGHVDLGRLERGFGFLQLDGDLIRVADGLGNYVEFVPVCPEVECGLSVPREAMRLVGDPQNPHLMTVRSGVDYTERMLNWARKRVVELEQEGLCGFIFKSGSPSSGMERVKVYGPSGSPAKTGVGLFAWTFMEHFPLLPVEEEGRLHDPKLRENFIEAIFTLKRWREMLDLNGGRGALVDFHTRHKLLLRAHSLEHLRQMGKLVAQAADVPVADLYDRYQKLLLSALGRKTTTKKNKRRFNRFKALI